jgi:hypothetical protein
MRRRDLLLSATVMTAARAVSRAAEGYASSLVGRRLLLTDRGELALIEPPPNGRATD